MSSAARLSAALSDRYRIERELGTGGMATVWLAEDLKHDRKVAVKVLRPELTAVLGGDRFNQEIKSRGRGTADVSDAPAVTARVMDDYLQRSMARSTS